jgi:cell division protein FtsB
MCKDCGCQSSQDCGCECGCNCGCGGHGQHSFTRHYQTKAEQIAELEAYLSELKTEVQAVEEHLADLHQ